MDLNTDDNDNKEYKVEAIRNSAIYARKSESGHLLGLYYLAFWKSYQKEENIWKSYLAVQHFKKLISSFHKDHSDKSTTNFEIINTISPMARLTIKPITTAKLTKQKQDWPANSNNKQNKNN